MGIVTEVSYENDCIKVGDGDQGFKVWQPSTEYGWTATSSIKNSSGKYVKYDSEGTLALPEIDLRRIFISIALVYPRTELLHIARQVPERGSALRWQRDQADRIQMACW